MKFITNLFKPRTASYHDKILGELSIKLEHKNPPKDYSWSGNEMVLGQSEPTYFFLEGDDKKPYDDQLKSAYQILATRDEIMQAVAIEILKQEDLKDRFKGDWKKDFYLASLDSVESDVVGKENQYEYLLEFQDNDIDNDDTVEVTWINGELSDILAY